MATPDVEIIVGTYEEFLLGYKAVKKGDSNCRLIQSFADHSHRASIRSVCVNGKFLASGSADETIHLYDMKARKESGILLQHSGTVNCLSFSPDGSHLLSGSEDGSIAIFRTGSWQLEKLFSKAHKGEAVTFLSVHPSGKLALSVGNDATLRTWNLVKGRQAYATNLGKNHTGKGRAVSCLLWSPDGNLYVIAIGTEVNIYNISTASIVHTVQLQKKDTILTVGDEGGGLSFHSISDKKQLNAVEAHEHRIKCVSFISMKEDKFLVSASSGGQIKLWICKDGKVKNVCCINTDCRITCLVVLEGPYSRCHSQKHMKAEVMETHPIHSGTGNDEKALELKRPRKDGEDSESINRILDNKAKSKNSKVSKTSHLLDVICTRGQKWFVEEM